MAIKADVQQIKTVEVKYPKLMKSISNGTIVLFVSWTSGTIISSKAPGENVGYYSSGWLPENFVDFNGSVTLTND